MPLALSRLGGASGDPGGPGNNVSLYIVPVGGSTRVAKVFVNNQGAVPATFRLAVVPNGGAAADPDVNNDWFIQDMPVEVDDTFEVPGFEMASNDTLVIDSVAAMNFVAFGVEKL